MSNDIPTELPNLPPRSLDWSHILENEYIVLTRLQRSGAQQQLGWASDTPSAKSSLLRLHVYDWTSLKLYVDIIYIVL